MNPQSLIPLGGSLIPTPPPCRFVDLHPACLMRSSKPREPSAANHPRRSTNPCHPRTKATFPLVALRDGDSTTPRPGAVHVRLSMYHSSWLCPSTVGVNLKLHSTVTSVHIVRMLAHTVASLPIGSSQCLQRKKCPMYHCLHRGRHIFRSRARLHSPYTDNILPTLSG